MNPKLLALLSILLMAPGAAGAGDRHFSELRVLVDRYGPERPLNQAAAARLAEELVMERLLWEDEVAYHRSRLAAAGARVGLKRLEVIDAEVHHLLDAVEQRVAHRMTPDAELTARLLDRGERWAIPAWTILSGSPPRPKRPLLHRQVRIAEQPPPEYFTPPTARIWNAVAVTKGGEDPGGWDVDEADPTAIALKAQELEHDPVALYQFVLNQIRAEHYFGSLKSATAVLQSGSGNDADQAALLAALFRASGFPARVAWGVQEIRISSLLNHFGVDSRSALEPLLTRAGIPWTPVVVGGQVQGYQLERSWCEVWIPFANFRGIVLDRSGSTWLRLDPQLKPMAEDVHRPILEELAFDPDLFLDDFLAGTFCNGDLNQAGACPTAREVLVQQVNQYLADQGEPLTYEDLVASREQLAESMPILPAAMVGNVVSVIGTGLDYPVELRHHLSLRASAGAEVLMDITLPVAELSGREAVLWYTPATPEDERIVAAYDDYLWEVPPYLVQVTPQILVLGEELARGSSGIGMGQPYTLEATLLSPSLQETTFTNTGRAGVPFGLGIAAGPQGYTPEGIEPASTPELLSKLANDYLDSKTMFEEEQAALLGLQVVHPQPSLVWIGSMVDAEGAFGIITNLAWKGIFVDADLWGAEPAGGRPEEVRTWRMISRLQASTRERRVFELYDIASLSADKALMLAAAAGLRVWHIDSGNLSSILPILPYDENVLAEIEAWVLAGGEARVPEGPVASHSWNGIGYLLIDPETGDARYQLAGALSGSMTAVPPDLIPGPIRDPLAEPAVGRYDTGTDKAGQIEMFDGDLQIATVGEKLGDGVDRQSLKVLVKTLDGKRVVKDAEVVFSIGAGGGKLLDGGVEKNFITVKTKANGIASAKLRLGKETSANPYYITFAGDVRSTRCGMNIVHATVNGVVLRKPFYEFGKPGPVEKLLDSRGQEGGPVSLQGFPNTSVDALIAVPADQYKNPVSNHLVSYQLVDPLGNIAAGEGPLLLKEEERCLPGVIVAGECDGVGSAAVSDQGGASGVSAYLVLGPEPGPRAYQVNATTKVESGGVATLVFEGRSREMAIPSGHHVGEPAIAVVTRKQPAAINPASGSWESVEAYAPGVAAYPLVAEVLVITQNYEVVRCYTSETDYCTEPREGLSTRRLIPVQPMAPCTGSCPMPNSFRETAELRFSWSVPGDPDPHGVVVSDTVDESGRFFYIFKTPSEPYRYDISVEVRGAEIAIPKRPDETTDGAVYACPNGGSPCGAELTLKTYTSGPTSHMVIWSVKATVDEPVPVVELDHGNYHRGDTPFPFTITPAEYPALGVAMVFTENGAEVAVAETLGSGQTSATLGTGTFFQTSEATHRVRVDLNRQFYWSPTRGYIYPLTVLGSPQPVPVVNTAITASLSYANHDFDLTEFTGIPRHYQVLGGARIKLTANPDTDVSQYQWAANEGDFFDSVVSENPLSGADLQRREIWWQGPAEINKNSQIDLQLTVGPRVVARQTTMKTRLLEYNSGSLIRGDDVRMMQAICRYLGFSEKDTPGVYGTPVTVDGNFGSGGEKVVKRHQFRIGTAVSVAAANGKLNNDELLKLSLQWADYRKAYEAFHAPQDEKIDNKTPHPQFSQWLPPVADRLQQTYTDALHQTVAPGVDYLDLINAWVTQEAATHWGSTIHRIPFRVTLGSGDEYGSIGFSQILNKHRYGSNARASMIMLNLYHPADNLVGFAAFSNDTGVAGGGGFYKAFVSGIYTNKLTATSFPNLGAEYTDDDKDLLAKALCAYNTGSNRSQLNDLTWPETFRDTIPPPPKATRGGMRNYRTAVEYTLEVQERAGVPLRCWTWRDQAITTGDNGWCETAVVPDDVLREYIPPILSLPVIPDQVCIIAKSGEKLNSVPASDDELKVFTFEYCEQDYLDLKSWDSKRLDAVPWIIE